MTTVVDEDRYVQGLGGAARVVAEVRPHALANPTPCTQWTVADLVNHLINVARLMARAASGEPFDPQVFAVDHTTGDMLAAFNAATRASIEAFARPSAADALVELPVLGQFPAEGARTIHFVDCVTHTWDLARALGRDPGIDNDLAEAAAKFAPVYYSAVPRGPDSPFLADEVEVASAAPPLDRLVAYLGRDPRPTRPA